MPVPRRWVGTRCNSRNWEVFLPLPGMELDFGGVVKEYAADAAAMVAGRAGIRHGLVNLGGDIRIVGPRADGRPWPIGIVHPQRPDAAIATLPLAEGAVTTSGRIRAVRRNRGAAIRPPDRIPGAGGPWMGC